MTLQEMESKLNKNIDELCATIKELDDKFADDSTGVACNTEKILEKIKEFFKSLDKDYLDIYPGHAYGK